jgi:hypothetical protein
MTEPTSESAIDTASSESIIAFGHSHLSALIRAGRSLTGAGHLGTTGLRFVRLNHSACLPNFLVKAGVREVHPLLAHRLRSILERDRPKAVFLSLFGNELSSIGLIQHPQPFDFHWPEMDLPADPQSTVIPFDLMKAQLRFSAENSSLLLWRFFASIYSGPIYLAPPPPPIEDETHIKSHPGPFADQIATQGLSRPDLRLKLWMLYCDVLREAVLGKSTKFVELPFEIFDEGYLKSIYWQHDPLHGNQAYGDVVLRRMLSLAKALVAVDTKVA